MLGHIILTELPTGEVRNAVLDDMREIARIVDALDSIHSYLNPICPAEPSEDQVEISKYYVALGNTLYVSQSGGNIL